MADFIRTVGVGRIVEDRNPIRLDRRSRGASLRFSLAADSIYRAYGYNILFPAAPSILSLNSLGGFFLNSATTAGGASGSQFILPRLDVEGNMGNVSLDLGTNPLKADRTFTDFALTTYANRRESRSTYGNIGSIRYAVIGDENEANLSFVASQLEVLAEGRPSAFGAAGAGGGIGQVTISSAGDDNRITVSTIRAENATRGKIAGIKATNFGEDSRTTLDSVFAGNSIGNIDLANSGLSSRLYLDEAVAGASVGNIIVSNRGESAVAEFGSLSAAGAIGSITVTSGGKDSSASLGAEYDPNEGYGSDDADDEADFYFQLGEGAIVAQAGVGNITSNLGTGTTDATKAGIDGSIEVNVRNGLFVGDDDPDVVEAYGLFVPGDVNVKSYALAFYYENKALNDAGLENIDTKTITPAKGNIGTVSVKTVGATGSASVSGGFSNLVRVENAADPFRRNSLDEITGISTANGAVGNVSVETSSSAGSGETGAKVVAMGNIGSVAVKTSAISKVDNFTTFTGASAVSVHGSVGAISLNQSGTANSIVGIEVEANLNIGNVSSISTGSNNLDGVEGPGAFIGLTSFTGNIGTISHKQTLAASSQNVGIEINALALGGNIGAVTLNSTGTAAENSQLIFNGFAGNTMGALRATIAETSSSFGLVDVEVTAVNISDVTTGNTTIDGETFIDLVASEMIGNVTSTVGNKGFEGGDESLYTLIISSYSDEVDGSPSPLNSGKFANVFAPNEDEYTYWDPDGYSSLKVGDVNVTFEANNAGTGNILINTTQYWKPEDLGFLPLFSDDEGSAVASGLGDPAVLGSDIGAIKVSGGTADAEFNLDGDDVASAVDAGDVKLINWNGDEDFNRTVWARTVESVDFSTFKGFANISLWGVIYGDMEIKSSLGGSEIITTLSEDSIVLAQGGGVDTVNLADIMQGPDKITGFSVGVNKDVLSLWRSEAVETDGATTYELSRAAANLRSGITTSDPLTDLAIAEGDVIQLADLTGGQDVTTAQGLYEALTEGEYRLLGEQIGDKYVWVASASSSTATEIQLFKVNLALGVEPADTDNSFDASVQQLATLSGITGGLGALTQNNFSQVV